MHTHILGYPRIGPNRETKKVLEKYWSGKQSLEDVLRTGKEQREYNRQVQKEAGLDLVPVNDFSFYDHILDMAMTVGAIPKRFQVLNHLDKNDLYFAMARGYQKEDYDIIPMEMTKWFDTNYHYIVPEFIKDQKFEYYSDKIINEFKEAKTSGVNPKPVIIGPVSFLLLGKEKDEGFDRLDLIEALLPVYNEILTKLQDAGAEWVQFDEPFLAMDISEKQKEILKIAYSRIRKGFPSLKILLANYFEGLHENMDTAFELPVDALHLDLVENPEQLQEIMKKAPETLTLSLGVVDGRNIWKNNFDHSLDLMRTAAQELGYGKIMVSTSSSLLHVPYDLDLEDDEKNLPPQIKNWMAFAKQKLHEVVTLRDLIKPELHSKAESELIENRKAI
ncbi:MAG: 5-methyltetrahydropteroyltriglutamate--homocysteine S-methyltransferase, partial [Bacteroidota bacterium]